MVRGAAADTHRHRQPARIRAPRVIRPAPRVRAPVRAGGRGSLRAGPCLVQRRALDRPIRFDAVHQCGRRCRDRDARLDSPALLRPAALAATWGIAISDRCTPNPVESVVRAQLGQIRGASDSGETQVDEEGEEDQRLPNSSDVRGLSASGIRLSPDEHSTPGTAPLATRGPRKVRGKQA